MPEPAFLNDRYLRTEAVLTMIRTVLRRLLLASAVIGVVSVGVGLLVGGLPGLWSALLATAISVLFTGTTMASLYAIVGRGPELLQIVLLGGWILKMGLLAVLLLWLRNENFYHRGVFLATLFVVVIVGLIVEIGTLVTARIPYVAPSSTEPSQDDDGASTVADPGPGEGEGTPTASSGAESELTSPPTAGEDVREATDSADPSKVQRHPDGHDRPE
ncbi:hypothetical protein [Ruania zhangjianzhongii]|uniref:hypothetical protein n=1 Tax=Ruania zhangjianzhongii TaxID=2603206 RepID=UPI0011C9D321|nr:hypothetical protein [Ruania zhangjianzhongii]